MRQPVGDREERGSTPVTQVLHRTFWRRRHIPSRGDDSNPRPREPRFHELLREIVARGDQDVRSSQREPIERLLRPRATSAVVDAARRLMEDGNHGNAETARRESWSCECRGDRVEKEGARPELLRPTKHRCAAKSGERERPLGKGQEADPRLMRSCRVCHPQVVQIAPAQAARIAERDERENEMRVVRVDSAGSP